MATPQADQRSPERRAKDEEIAAGPKLAAPALPPDAPAESVEAHLARAGRKPLAAAGVVGSDKTLPSPPKYVLQGSFDVPPATWERAKEEIRAILIEKAKQRAMIPYSELVARVTSVNFSA